MGYLFAAYSIIWVILFGYVFYLYLRQRKALRDIELLKESLDKQGQA
jgi:CcmD family protein